MELFFWIQLILIALVSFAFWLWLVALEKPRTPEKDFVELMDGIK